MYLLTNMHYKRRSLDELLNCYECGSSDIEHDTKHGEKYCADCGLVLEDKLIDEGPEWREFESNNPDASRVGQPSTPAYFYASRTIMNVKEASKGNKDLVRRLAIWNTRTNKSKERNLIHALTKLDALSGQLGLTRPTQERAAVLYRQAAEKNLIRGRSRNGLIGACVYIAGRLNNQTQSYDVLAEKVEKSKKEICSYVRTLQRELDLAPCINTPMTYIPKFICQLAENENSCFYEYEEAKLAFENQISELHNYFESTMTNIGNPQSAAAAYIYIANVLSGAGITQTEISKVSGVTEVTVRNRYREFVKFLPDDVKKDYFPRQ